MSFPKNSAASSQQDLNNTVTTPIMSFSYSQAAQQVNFPTKEQAIVTDALEGVSIKDYTVTIGNITDPRNIRFVSRISHGRICLYLNSQETVDKLLNTHKFINIGTHTLQLRPLVSKSKRIILSNVCPIIPHKVIEDKLTDLNIALKSQISFIRAGMNDPRYSHILSFRRQVYVDPEDIKNLPETIQVNFENTLYWIYISTDRLTCFLCKEEGHLAKYCHNGESSNQQTSKSFPQEKSTTEIQPAIPVPVTSRSPVTIKEKESPMVQEEVFKQPALASTSGHFQPPPSQRTIHQGKA